MSRIAETFAGLRGHTEFRTVTRAHVIAWRKHLEVRGLADSTIRRKTRPEDSPTFRVRY